MEAAKKWGLSPSQFDNLPEIERARIIAHERVMRMRDAHISKVQRDVAEEEAPKK